MSFLHVWNEITKAILSKKNKADGVIIPDLKIYKVIVPQTTLYICTCTLNKPKEQTREPRVKNMHLKTHFFDSEDIH